MAVEKKQTGARIPPELYRRLKVLAAQHDRRIGELVQEAIEDLLKKYKRRI
jgi:predicted DNA-binding protein